MLLPLLSAKGTHVALGVERRSAVGENPHAVYVTPSRCEVQGRPVALRAGREGFQWSRFVLHRSYSLLSWESTAPRRQPLTTLGAAVREHTQVAHKVSVVRWRRFGSAEQLLQEVCVISSRSLKNFEPRSLREAVSRRMSIKRLSDDTRG